MMQRFWRILEAYEKLNTHIPTIRSIPSSTRYLPQRKESISIMHTNIHNNSLKIVQTTRNPSNIHIFGEWIKKMWFIFLHCSAVKRNKLLHTTTHNNTQQQQQQIMMPSGKKPDEKRTCCVITLYKTLEN